jgi:hypothetical protein
MGGRQLCFSLRDRRRVRICEERDGGSLFVAFPAEVSRLCLVRGRFLSLARESRSGVVDIQRLARLEMFEWFRENQEPDMN